MPSRGWIGPTLEAPAALPRTKGSLNRGQLTRRAVGPIMSARRPKMPTVSRFAMLLLLVFPVCSALLLPGDAEAEGLMSYSLRNAVLTGEDRPAVLVDVGQNFTALTLELERNDGQTLRVGGQPARRGEQVTLAFDQPEGTFSYRAKLIGNYPSSEGEGAHNLTAQPRAASKPFAS